MSWRTLLLPVMLVALTACAAGDSLSTSEPGGYYSYGPPEQEPDPGVAEGRPVVKIERRGTFYLCPELAIGRTTPLLTDPCLVADPGIGHTRIEGYSMLDASVKCAAGKSATDAGTLGIGFVGEPLIGEGQSSADRGRVLDCLWGLDR